MGITDIIILVCFIPAVIQGLRKGFVSQAISLVAIFAGIFLAIKFNGVLAPWLSGFIHADEKSIKVISFIVLIIAGILLMKFAGRMLTKLLDFATLGMANRIAGLAFALFEYAIIIGLAISLFDNLNSKLTLVDPQTLTDSPVYMYLKDFAGKVFPYLKELASGIGTTGSEITTEIANV